VNQKSNLDKAFYCVTIAILRGGKVFDMILKSCLKWWSSVWK